MNKSDIVFDIFNKLCKIPHGSGDMQRISNFCVDFAKEYNLDYIQDDALNVVIFKAGTGSLKDAEPIILQGHIDMVCQAAEDMDFDFSKDEIKTYIEGDLVKAEGTTLGADNGIAVAMIMAILQSDDIEHPPIEAVFTTDEEIGMIGAGKLDMSVLKAKRMINLDAEDDDELTVSCAGGCDVKLTLPLNRVSKRGDKVKLTIKNLQGGHSGIEIDNGRVNANILMGRLLNYGICNNNFNLLSIDGGTKGNAIPKSSVAELLVDNYDAFALVMNGYIKTIKNELSDREGNMEIHIEKAEEGCFDVIDDETTSKFIHILLTCPNGIVDMSKMIENLVETSLNLGILKTNDENAIFQFALRSNKLSALNFLKERLESYSRYLNLEYSTFGEYNPWEYKEDSILREQYIETYKKMTENELKVVAIHAGLECAVFSAKIPELDCIAIGPTMRGVHTIEEELSISSTEKIFAILCEILKGCK